MPKRLDQYREIVGDQEIYEIYHAARPLLGKRVVHINSTYVGGGVAEMLNSIVPLMNSIGILAGWRILHGTPDFFTVTKSFHNALQGAPLKLTEEMKKIYVKTNEDFSVFTHLTHDFVIVHDPQPLPLISFYQKRQPWIWRCHIDLSSPNEELWNFLKGFVLAYDAVIVSSEGYKKPDLPNRQVIFHPAIDPLSDKNRELPQSVIDEYIKRFNIPTDKPIITQISRFDPWKDPLGVIKIFRLVKQEVDARLILCGNMATDDPEGWKIYDQVRREASDLIERGDLLLITVDSSILVNVLQRISTVIVQKSTREGFGLTVTEAMYKGTPVVASRVGGIVLQIEDGKSGFLLDPYDYEGFARKIVELLRDPELRRYIGENAKKRVVEKFLITRLLKDYLYLLRELM